jgi:pimeloyl-ACP methyl ester carboxylesterase
MPKIQTNGITLHYVQRGSGPDVVLIHGVTSSLAMWYNGVLPALTERYRVTIYDLRGHGLSDITPNGYTSAQMAEDLHALMDATGVDRPVIVGHSFGGAIALHFAALYPHRVAGVVMLDSGLACLRHLRIIEGWSGWKERPEELMKRGLTLEQFLELDTEQDVTAILRHGVTMPRQAGFKKGQSGLTPRLARLLDETRIGYEFRDVAGLTEELLTGIQNPVLALYGERSPYQKMALRLRELLPNCRSEVLSGVGHFYAVHRPEFLVRPVAEFAENPLRYVQPDSALHNQAGK